MSVVDDNVKNLLNEINKFDTLSFKDKSRFILELKKWLYNSVKRNYRIKQNSRSESTKRPRQNVYCIDFGVNIGREFNYFHFCVVIKEFNNTAIVVPLSTEKENDPEWKSASNLMIPIGVIEDMPKDKKPVYALVNQMKTVSKQRLTDYYVKEEGKHYPMMLDAHQMKAILDAITNSIGQQQIKERIKVKETV
ncbi:MULTISPECIES: type II toxin-antitoxin system PemK/MazF family toxin [Cytobacillus]|uniref:type II toxin-antitoxin system PemK/MazF family toxin n=1 Tax=Cytobacillus TaxID=2675230 RepID=UPI00203BAB95|nr:MULTISPECIES: type II toxin-antitoxin system PemK/MazF family toxin [Cytobacillus]MCM3394848.1 type II toxin-antitoxin system PemK/MazF family toxin [Cytobacillus oceanisediminis]UQX56073.1 type II toxin-antitoxin system PemK/MazF family toxin [Cytobacillus pseudoceanisediminis]